LKLEREKTRTTLLEADENATKKVADALEKVGVAESHAQETVKEAKEKFDRDIKELE